MSDEPLRAALVEARALLRGPPVRREPFWPTLAAAAFFAISALTFAAASILAPSVQLQPVHASILRGAD